MKRRTFVEMVAKAIAVGAWSVGIPGDVGPLYLQPFEPYGRIVFQIRPEAPNQIYIVGQLHEHPFTEEADQETIETQRDIYRVGERLIKERGLELVVLESLYRDTSYEDLNEALRRFGKILQRGNVLNAMKVDNHLERILDTEVEGISSPEGPRLLQASAGYWLASTHKLRVVGAEDAKLHSLALEAAKLVVRTGRLAAQRVEEARIGKYRLGQVTILNPYDHLNQLRTAYILHNTPLVMEREQAAKHISRQQALVVIGADHIRDCIRFVRNDYLKVLAYPGSIVPPLDQPLGYAQAGYGVTVIMPRTIDTVKF